MKMAFEDRCSPNQANSPGPMPNKVPSTDSTCPSPNDRPLKPYTCNTITPKHERSTSPVQNIPYKRPQYPSPIYGHLESPKDNNQSLIYHPYLNGFFINGIPRPLDYTIPFYEHVTKDMSVNGVQDKVVMDEDLPKLKFSINNILKPEFGSKKSIKKQPTVPYKPYDLVKNVQDKASASHLGQPPRLLPTREDFGFASSRSEVGNKRPDSANSSISTSSSTVSSQGAVQNGNGGYGTGSDDGGSTKTASGDNAGRQWPAWVYCTRYSDRPSSGQFHTICCTNCFSRGQSFIFWKGN